MKNGCHFWGCILWWWWINCIISRVVPNILCIRFYIHDRGIIIKTFHINSFFFYTHLFFLMVIGIWKQSQWAFGGGWVNTRHILSDGKLTASSPPVWNVKAAHRNTPQHAENTQTQLMCFHQHRTGSVLVWKPNDELFWAFPTKVNLFGTQQVGLVELWSGNRDDIMIVHVLVYPCNVPRAAAVAWGP